MLGSFFDILFPPVCLLCANSLRDGPLCKACASGLDGKRISAPVCTVCGTPFPQNSGGYHACGQCIKSLPPFVMARSAYSYGSSVLDAVHRLKYGNDTALSVPLGRIMAAFACNALPIRPDIVIPVPLHEKRLRERGYNQSLLLAREVARHMRAGLDYTGLIRVRETKPQTALKSGERTDNVGKAFALTAPSIFNGKRTLLIDDVFTTGATVRECAKALKKAGAEVYVLTLARAC
ncbi:MAG: ComF family protein [Deltaproteobacteria bacterium]|nr:ComF family protein [Deltaproteobacteria bacterium]